MYTTKSDVWSFGILIWEIVTLGGTPYSGMKSRLLIRRLHEGYRLPKPRNCEDALYHVMMRCWERLPTDRPTFSELVQELKNMMRDMTNYINVDDDYEYEVVESGDDDDDGDFMM
ncbi:tyrosine-protein kinase receptor Tie-1-like [Branchiostoma floridae]|uniref:Tyrosine-protein kinase receptor Tie-1-like n=1 Tax=Branchiostoma floridae TaxID=7739 RepID=A0A9J7L7N5_BRAFL|nr:tyrosine-protein kinase receptor Tie-1-like [Branchiostoma floridae]